MSSWILFLIGFTVITVLTILGVFFYRSRHPFEDGQQKTTQDTRMLLRLLWVASICIMAYVAFVFGKR